MSTAKIRRCQLYRNPAGTQAAFIDVELPSGMVVNGCKLMIGGGGKHWIATPAEKAVNKDGSPRLNSTGKQIWVQHVDFIDASARNRFTALVLEALQREHPDALNGSGS